MAEDKPFIGRHEELAYLTQLLELLNPLNKKTIIVLDEFQWMCPKGSSVISALQEQWDKSWKKNRKIYLVLCGSIISFMEKNILSEKSPLFGRRTASFELEPLTPKEAKLFFPKRTPIEICQILMTLGGIPSYLELIVSKESFVQNVNRMALIKDRYFSFIYSNLEQIQLNNDDWLFDKIVAPTRKNYIQIR